MRATGRGRSRPLIEEALTAARETRTVEFKEEFDPSDRRSLCETLKDVLAMANTGAALSSSASTAGDAQPART